MSKSVISKENRLSHLGEGFFQSLLSEYAILHKVEGSNDIGIDYFCEWLNQKNSESANSLFAVQLKTTRADKVILKKAGRNTGWSNLMLYEIKKRDKNGNSRGNYDGSIKPETIEYWRGFEIPVYLFVVVLDGKNQNKLFYKRYTPILDKTDRGEGSKFHLASKDSNSFLAFADNTNKRGGFCRDFYIDYVRCNYYRGALIYKNPRDFGLNQFSSKKFFFDDLLSEQYIKQVRETIKFVDEIKKHLNTKKPGLD
jgi:hypothetical protein